MKVYIGRYPKDPNKEQKIEIRIDPWDTWSMDTTLSMIILPMLKQLRETKHGAGFVDDEDAPEELRSTAAPPKEHEWDTDDNHWARYEWMLDELIWTFTQIHPDTDWEDQYWKVKPELDLDDYPEDEGKKVIPVRWKVEGQCDWDGHKAHQARIDNGLRLFGKYFQTLWD